jgi:hypothetical protein
LCTAWIDDKFSVDRPTLASEINVSNGISDKAKQLMLLNLLMHLALHLHHKTLIESYLNFMVIREKVDAKHGLLNALFFVITWLLLF